MFAVLGKIEFEVAGGFTGLEQRGSANWAEHNLIQGKPLLEWVGESLDELTFTMALHPWLGDPEAQLRILAEAKSKHDPLAFVLGSGKYVGNFVIVDINNALRRTSADGRPYATDVQISLKEYAGPFTPKVPRPGLIDPATSTTSMAKLSPTLVSKLAPVLTAAQKALGYARQAGTMIGSAKEIYDAVKNTSPAMLLARAPQLLGVTERVLGPIKGFSEAASLLSDGGDLVQLGQQVFGDFTNAKSSLNPLDLNNVVDRVENSGRYVSQAYDKFNGASTRLSGLAAQVITRRA
ncbi:Phage protein U [Pseudomonas putida]|nr:Phage protein U [Pseudomonas putida]CAB5542105.1 Phage protein U [Pseudomonas putida]CAB5543467.1 Phage protein U [Pseudomonas putida]CAB5638021.1 Phage protein U [Pseudomonas putida]CAB5653927.1 Phage protein U [Pseudomonas putida]